MAATILMRRAIQVAVDTRVPQDVILGMTMTMAECTTRATRVRATDLRTRAIVAITHAIETPTTRNRDHHLEATTEVFPIVQLEKLENLAIRSSSKACHSVYRRARLVPCRFERLSNTGREAFGPRLEARCSTDVSCGLRSHSPAAYHGPRG